MKEPNEIKTNTWDIYSYIHFLVKVLILTFLTLVLLSFAFTQFDLRSFFVSVVFVLLSVSHLSRISIEGSFVLALPLLGKKTDNQALK